MIITEVPNSLPITKILKEKMSVFLSDVNKNLPNRNGGIYVIIGSPGSGKSNLLFSTLFGDKNYYRGKFDNIYLITPESSFLSLKSHPFEKHPKVYYDLSVDVLEDIYDELTELKLDSIENKTPFEYSCIIIDDFANELKSNTLINILKKILIKSRHLNCFIIFTLQAYNLFPKVLRKMITNVSVFKPKNNAETESIREELVQMSANDFDTLYNYVYDSPYTHMDIDTNTSEIRRNFNLLNIKK